MKTKDWQKVNEIVLDALELDAANRQEFIKQNCAGNPQIQREVESLLAGEPDAENFFSESAALNYAGFLNVEDDPEAIAGQEIGNYRIIREIGRGGMGSVYLAERADGNFEQQVALKLLKRELNTANLRRRFRHERQILAALQHPNIARLLDAGTSRDNVPFLAMEYVEGLPIDVFCDKHNYDLKQRLTLFRAVCDAVAYAHRNLVVHRDLKPSNILVSGDGTPKLLDFGIAKLLTSEFEAQSEHTITQLGAMTPSYASPEQLRLENVSTTTDVYSLGVILYELLTGRRPFEGDVQKVIKAACETEPPLPSSIIKSVSEDKNQQERDETLNFDEIPSSVVSKTKVKSNITANQLQHTEPQFVFSNPHLLKGDLDNIVLKALKKEPERRYSSVEFFSEDIRRHLEGLPVTARPDTFSYRAEKFIKRHRTGAAASLLILVAIFSGVIATFWQSKVAAAERDRARSEAEKAKKINAYMQNVLNFSNVHWLSSNPKRNRNATIAEAIDEALNNIDNDLGGEPEIQGEVLFTLGQTYVSQGQYDKAEKVLRKAMVNFDQVFGQENVRSMQASVILGDTLYLTGKFDEAEKFYIAAINYFRPRVAEDASHNKWLAIALNDMGNVHGMRGRFAEGKTLVEESIKYAEKLTGKDRFAYPVVLGNLGAMLDQQGDFSGALNYFNRALEKVREMGNERKFEGGVLHNNIARSNAALKNYDVAEKHFLEAYDILKNAVGEENIYTLQNRYHLANAYYRAERYKEAREIIENALVLQRKAFPNHFTVAFSQGLLGAIYTKTNQLEKGETELREALDLISKSLKEPNHEISTIKMRQGENLIAQKRFSEAKEVLTSALDGYLKTKGENHPFTQRCREVLNEIPKQ